MAKVLYQFNYMLFLRQYVVDVHRRTLQPDEAITQRMSTGIGQETMMPKERGGGKKRAANVPASRNPGDCRRNSKGKIRKSDDSRPKRTAIGSTGHIHC